MNKNHDLTTKHDETVAERFLSWKAQERERERVEKMEVESGASRGRRVNELETHLSLYTTPPDQSVSLEEFENFA